MRIALINEGTYPYGSGALGTWCEQLVRGLDEHAFWLVNLVEGRPAVASALPPNVARIPAARQSAPSSYPSESAAAVTTTSEVSWPRVVVAAGATNLIYEPKVDSWDGYKLVARNAVEVQPTPQGQGLEPEGRDH